MIITVTLNTAIDKTLSVPNFRLGRRHRTVEQTTMPGGKGVNVARVLKTLGAPVIATGLTGGPTGTRIVDQLTQLSVLSDFVRIREESRTNTAVIDPTTGEQTEINERGPKVSEQEIELFVDKLLYLAKGACMCVFAGSLPREVDIDIYARLIRELRRLGVATVVDTDGDPLRRAVRAEPDVVSPNVLEAEELVGHEFNDDEDRIIAVREMVGLGAREAIMTMPDGCFAQMLPTEPGGDPRLYRVRVPAGAVEPRATVGSGDAFLAGFVAARYAGKPTAECLAYGVACGAESTQHLGAGLVDPDRVAAPARRDRGGTSGTTGRSRLRRRLAWGLTRPPSSPRIHRMEVEIGRGKKARRAYGFDDVAIVPSRRTRDPDDVDITWTLGPTGSSCRCSPPRWTASCRRDGRASSASSAASRSSTSRASGPATRTPTPSSSASPRSTARRRRGRCRRSTWSRSRRS